MTCILSNRLFVPKELVTDEMREAYRYEWVTDEHPHLTGKVRRGWGVAKDAATDQWWAKHQTGMWKEGPFDTKGEAEAAIKIPPTLIRKVTQTYKESTHVVSFARGDMGKVQRYFGHLPIVDERVEKPLLHDVRFTGRLYEEQQRVIDEWFRLGYGMIRCPPAFGKTVSLVNAVCRLRQNTLILVHLRDLRQQWLDTFLDPNFTNIAELEEQSGERIAGILGEDEEDNGEPVIYPITITTYHAFLSTDQRKRLMQFNRDSFEIGRAH